jgi:hypothetical protein
VTRNANRAFVALAAAAALGVASMLLGAAILVAAVLVYGQPATVQDRECCMAKGRDTTCLPCRQTRRPV